MTLSDKWRLDRLIGVGGTAAVYEAQHRNESRVAVKVLHRRSALSPEQLLRFHREGRAANRVGHSGVAAVHDDDVDEHGSPFLVMDLLKGQTVAERAAEAGGALPPEEVLDIADRLLDVLVAAHARDILHRDIKPQNLFLTDAGDFKVLDFGIARLTDPAIGAFGTEVGTLLGTPAFVPPEQARGRPDEMDARSDLWAVGATMYTLLTGRFVHEAATPTEQLGLAMMAAAPSLGEAAPALPKQLVLVVDRALSYSRDERWPDARSMQEAVRWLREHWEHLSEASLEAPAAWVVRAPVRSGGGASVVTVGVTAPRFEFHDRFGVLVPLLLVAFMVVGVLAFRHPTGAPARQPAARTAAPTVESLPPRNSPLSVPNLERPAIPSPAPESFATSTPPLRRVAPIRNRSPLAVPEAPASAPSTSPAMDVGPPLVTARRNPLDRRY